MYYKCIIPNCTIYELNIYKNYIILYICENWMIENEETYIVKLKNIWDICSIYFYHTMYYLKLFIVF